MLAVREQTLNTHPGEGNCHPFGFTRYLMMVT
jgi:hypothetical protein